VKFESAIGALVGIYNAGPSYTLRSTRYREHRSRVGAGIVLISLAGSVSSFD